MAQNQNNAYSLYETTITIGDVIVTNGIGSTFMGAIIDESISDLYSVCKIEFEGSPEFINSIGMVDGTPIAIHIKSKEFGFNFVYHFRVAEVTITQGTNSNYHYAVTGYTDFYKLFEAPINYSLYGKSSDVFKNVAKENELEYEIDDTNDEQLWICSEQNLKNWLSTVCSKGWVDQTSGMFWCIDRHRCLLYKNIDNIFKQKTKYTLAPMVSGGTIQSDTIGFIAFSSSIQSGKENIDFNGYGGGDFHFDFNKYQLVETNAQYITAFSKSTNINKELSNGLAKTFYPIDTGNFHTNYFLAYDQNMRVLSTFSTRHEFVCQFFQPVRLGQLVTMKINSVTDEIPNQSLNMKGLINKILINISESVVTMNIQTCTQGFNGVSTTTY